MKRKSISLILSMITALSVFVLLSAPLVNAQEEERYFFEFHIMCIEGFEAHRMMAEMVQNECGKIGIKVTIDMVDFSIFMDRMYAGGKTGELSDENGWDTWLCQFGDASELDPDNMGTLFHSKNEHPAGWNCEHWFNGKFDELMDEAAVLTDIEARKPYYKEAMEILADELPSTTICYLKDPWVMRSNVMGFDGVLGCYGLGAYTWDLEDEEGGTVKYAQPGSLPSLVMEFAGAGTTGRAVGHTVWEALMDYDNKYNPVGELAESWTVSEDSLTWTFKLYENVLWHDGEPFTADDIVCTYDAAMDPETVFSSHSDFKELVDSYRAVDDYTFELTLTKPSAAAWSKIFTQTILPKHILDDVPHGDWKSHDLNTKLAIGTGPYKMVDWKPQEYVEIAVNEDYYRGQAPLDHVFFVNIPDAATALAALEKGDVDILDTYYSLGKEVPQIETNPDLKYVLRINPGAVHFMFQLSNPVLNNKWVRKAISSCIPRQQIVDDILAGLGDVCTSYIHPLTWAYDPDISVPMYDLDQAKIYMEMAGFEYEWLEPPPTTPMSAYLLPAVGGLVAGIVVGAIVMSLLKRTS